MVTSAAGTQPYGIFAEYDHLSGDQPGRLRPMGDTLVLNDAERKLLSKVENRANNELLYGLKYHVMRRAFLDLSYYNGFQHIYWDYNRHRLSQVPLANNKSRVTHNKIMPAVQHAVKLLSSQIDFHVRPKNNDYKSRAAARMGDRAIRHLYRERRWSRKIRSCMRWAATTGVGFLRPYYNPNIGPEVEYFFDPSSGEPIPEEYLTGNAKEQLRRAGLSKKVREGDVDLGVHSPMEVYVPDTTTDTDDLQWYLIASRASLNKIRTMFPSRGHFVGPEQFSAWERNSFEARILSMAGGAAETGFEGFAGALTYDDDRSAILKIYVEPPSPDNPKGTFAAVAGGVLLEMGDSPSYTFGLNGCDLIKFGFIERPGSFWDISLPENAISPQRELNATAGQVSDFRRNVLKPKLLAPRGAALSKSSYYDVAAEIIEYDDQKAPPVWQPFPTIPPALFQSWDYQIQSLRDIFSQHEAMQGQNPSGVRAGYAINLLRERDLDFYSPIMESHAECWGVLWSHVHQLIKRTWSSKRLVQDMARSELVWSGWASGEELAENASVIIDAEASYPKSRAASQAFASEFLQFGQNLMMFPPLVRANVLEAMDMGDESKIKEIFELDKMWAEYALETMVGNPEKDVPGYDFPVRPGIDDHQIVLQVVRMFQKTRYYDELPPDAKARIERYAQGQTEMLVQGAMLQGAFEGGGGGQQKPGQQQNQEQDKQQVVTQ